MPLWNWIPPYGEEITINQVQETLSEFEQLVPEGFVELKQLNWMCSTQGWKEPACERYNCLINGEWKQVDIRHTLLEELGLEKGKNIPFPVHVSPAVRNKGLDHYLAYNVEEKEEIFLQKSFTIENLKGDIDGLLERIKKLEEEKEKLEKKNKKQERKLVQKDNEITELKRQKAQLETERDARPGNVTLDQWNNDYSRRPTQSQLNSIQQELNREKGWWDKIQRGIEKKEVSIRTSSFTTTFVSEGWPFCAFNCDISELSKRDKGETAYGTFYFCEKGLEWLKENRKKYF